MSAPVRLSVMGAGLIGERHIQHILARPEATLVSIIDPTPAARDMAKTLGVTWFPYFRDIPADKKSEGVVVSTPNQMHVANGLECIEAGVPALVEKPLADNLAGAQTLVDARRAAQAGQSRSPPWRVGSSGCGGGEERYAFALGSHTMETCYQIGGVKGSLAIPQLDFWSHPSKPGWWAPIERERLSYTYTPEDPLGLQIANFCGVIRGTAQPVVSGREGLKTLKVIDAVKRAARTALREAV
jgi:predicted dehydrogenase